MSIDGDSDERETRLAWMVAEFQTAQTRRREKAARKLVVTSGGDDKSTPPSVTGGGAVAAVCPAAPLGDDEG